MMNNIYIDIVGQSLFILAVITAVIGIIMAIKPEIIRNMSHRISVWVETESIIQNINRQQETDHFLYRHHRIIGAFIIIGAIYTLYILVVGAGGKSLAALLPASWSLLARQWLTDSLVYFFDVINILALFLGIIVFARPSALKDIEGLANRWMVSDSILNILDKQVDTDETQKVMPLRILGVLIMLGSVYIMTATLQFFH